MPLQTTPDQSGSEEDNYELQQALAMSLLESQWPVEPRAALAEPAAASARPTPGYTSQQEASVKRDTDALTLDMEDIKSAEGEAGHDRASLLDGSGGRTLQKSAGKGTAGKGGAAQATSDGHAAKKAKATLASEESGASKGRKRPAKGKAIEIYDPADISKAYDLISNGSSAIREHMLQKVEHHLPMH